MTRSKDTPRKTSVQELLVQDSDVIRTVLSEVLQQVWKRK
jgi:hypothetical protein